jgi:hypothetical protein
MQPEVRERERELLPKISTHHGRIEMQGEWTSGKREFVEAFFKA